MARRMPARTQCQESRQRLPSFSDSDVESVLEWPVCLQVVAGRRLTRRNGSFQAGPGFWFRWLRGLDLNQRPWGYELA